MGKIDVRIMEGKNLTNKDTFGKSDPYVVVSLEGRKYKTSTKKNSLSPKWEEKFSFMVTDEKTSQLQLQLFDDDLISDDPMGHYSISLAGLVKGQVSDNWYILHGCKSGSIRVRLLAVDFGLPPGIP